MNIKDEIKKLELELLKFKTIMSHDGAQKEVHRVKIALKKSLSIINKLQEVVEMQQKALEEINRDHYDHVMAPVVAMNTLEEVKQLLEGESNE